MTTVTVEYGGTEYAIEVGEDTQAAANSAASAAASAAQSEAALIAISLLAAGFIFDDAASGVDPVTGVDDTRYFVTTTAGQVQLYVNDGGVAVHKADFLTDALLALTYAKVNGSAVNALDYITADGSTNDAAGWALLATYVNSLPYGAAIAVPPGRSLVSGSTVTFTKPVTLVGYGQTISQIVFASNASFVFSGGALSSYSGKQFGFEGVGFRVSGVHTTGPLKVTFATGGSGTVPTFVGRDCSVQCHADGSSFAYGLWLENCSLPTFSNFRIEGDRDSYPITSVAGLKVTGEGAEYSFTGLNCYFVQTGVSGLGNLEGIKFDHCTMVAVRTGIDWQTSGGGFNPWFSFTGGHINAEDKAIRLRGVVEFTITGNDFYGQNADGSGSGSLNMIEIDSQYNAGVRVNGRITGNMFQGDNAYVAQANRTGINIIGQSGDTENIIIDQNQFQSLGKGVNLGANANGVLIGANNQYANVTTEVVNGGTGNSLPYGVYTPTLTGVANVAASAAYSAQWMRIGNIVTVSGKVDITPTSNTTLTQLGISLPASSNLTASNECSGAAAPATGTTGANPGVIEGDATNDRATMTFSSFETVSRAWHFQFTYRVQ